MQPDLDATAREVAEKIHTRAISSGQMHDADFVVPWIADILLPALRAVQDEEREACAKAADEYADRYPDDWKADGARACASAIRARGEAK